MPLTITEGLAEIKTIDARIAKKREFIKQNLVRQDGFRDPLEKEGGARVAIAKERQAIFDLGERKLTLRRAIQRANEETTIQMGEITRSIADWLVWRREVAPGAKQLLADIAGVIQSARNDATRKGFTVVATSGAAEKPTDVLVNVDEKALADQSEKLEELLGGLDGLLSLKNATVTLAL